MAATNAWQWGTVVAVLGVVLVLALAWGVWWLVALTVLGIAGALAGWTVARRTRRP